MNHMDIGLISCTKTKLDRMAKPRDLYSPSTLFQKAQRYAEENHDDWYILSAKYHLLEPDGKEIEPYDETLNDANKADREYWARTVVHQMELQRLFTSETRLIFHAGKPYYESILKHIPDKVEVDIPTLGLRIGETLSWYNDHLDN